MENGPPRRDSKSKLRTDDEVCLCQHFFGELFILQVLFVYVGYRMKTCTQISDSRFRGKINVVSLGNSSISQPG